MPGHLSFALAALAIVSLATAAPGAERHGKPHITARPSKGYGFLPGYRSPDQIAREQRRQYQYQPSYWYLGGHYYPGGPGFYRGRYNGGGFGPCYKWTPIGPMWTCG